MIVERYGILEEEDSQGVKRYEDGRVKKYWGRL